MTMEDPFSNSSKTAQTPLAFPDNAISLDLERTPSALGKRAASTPTEELQELLSNMGLKVFKPSGSDELFSDKEEEEAKEVMTEPTPPAQTEPSSSI